MFSFKRIARRVALCALVVLVFEKSCSATCNSGVLRMKPFPTFTYGRYDTCYASTPRQYDSVNSVTSFCGVEYRATVNGSGVVRLTPVSTATFRYNIPYPNIGWDQNYSMPCRNLNTSGLLQAGSTTSATVTMWDDVGGPISNLTKTGPRQVTLSIARTYSYSAPSPVCRYNYTVVSGCFMGIKAPSAPPACPARYYTATGLAGAKYCAPCPPGTSSTGPNSKSCTPCPAGTYNPQYGGKCHKCEPEGRYSAKPGSVDCNSCGVNEWTDGKKCAKCPPGSYTSTTNPKQCHKCKAGIKCCTVNPSKDCPACPRGWTPGPPATSVFALSSGSTPACLASNYALCAPKFNVTVRETCRMVIVPMPLDAPQEADCRWSATAAIKGRSANLKVDLSNFDDQSGNLGVYNALVDGNVTRVSAPYVDFTVAPVTFDNGGVTFAPTKCTLRYRALTTSAALLGAAPKPCPKGMPGCTSLAGTCRAGQYLETQTDTKPAPCLPCPPGTYNTIPSTKRCTPCPLGQFAAGYGNKACESCPATAPLTPNKGSATCQPCSGGVRVGVSKCKACRRYSGKPSGGAEACLSNQFGSVCCALGKCNGTPACPAKLQGFDDSAAGAVLQLVSRHLPQPLCRSATWLTCMNRNAVTLLYYPYNNGISFQMDPIMQPRCVGRDRFSSYLLSIGGFFTSAKRAAGTFNGTGFELLSDAATGTVTIGISKTVDPATTNTANLTQCTATFKLTAGYAFDLAPHHGAKCPSNAVTVKLGGRSFCKFCPAKVYKTSSGQCASCPAGTYQDLPGSTSCKPCPAGSFCPFTSLVNDYRPYSCLPGSYSPKAGAAECKECPANTYATTMWKATSCTTCPKFTAAPKGSVACSVPFPK